MSDVFFVFSPGRSGSTSFTRYLRYAKNADIFHEPVGGTQCYLEGIAENQKLGYPFSTREIFEGFRKEAIDLTLAKGLKYGELTPMLSYCAQGALEAYPDAKVIWLLRNPGAWIRSAGHTNFPDGDFTGLCKHWLDFMLHIYAGYQLADRNNRRIIKVEALTAEVRYEVYRWLGLEPQHDGAVDWMKQEFKEHTYSGPKWMPKPENWTDEQWTAYNGIIAPGLANIMGMYEVEGWHKMAD